jgi:hypothetical protein
LEFSQTEVFAFQAISLQVPHGTAMLEEASSINKVTLINQKFYEMQMDIYYRLLQ